MTSDLRDGRLNDSRPSSSFRCWATLGAILALGFVLRGAALDRVPPGLWFDEALNGQDAAAVWGWGVDVPRGFQMVYVDEFPREPLYPTLLALAVRLGGPRTIILRAVSLVCGLAAVALLFFALRAELGEGPALAAAGALAVMRWHVLFSRLVFRTIILTPWLTALVWAALAQRRAPTRWRAVALGALLGGGFYTYLAWYFMLPLTVGLALWAVWPRRRDTVWMLGVAVVVALPLAVHYWAHPAHLLARPGAVSPWTDGWGAGLGEVAENAWQAVGMFHWRGDHVAVQNLPHRPALDVLQGALMLWGLALCLWCALVGRRHRSVAWVLIVWLACGLATTILTVTDSPNFLRSLCLTPAVAALIGWGLADLARRATARVGRGVAVVGVAACLLVSAGWTARDVQSRWAHDPAVWHAFQGRLVQLGRLARRAPADTVVFMPQFLYASRTVQFHLLTAEADGRVHGYGDWSFVESPEFESGQRRWIVVTGHNALLAPLRELFPDGRVIETFAAPETGAWAAVYAVAPSAQPAPTHLTRLRTTWSRDMRF